MNNMMRKLVLAALLFVLSAASSAQVMTVQNLKELSEQGSEGERAAVAYVNGAVDGMVGLDFIFQKERNAKPEFCKFSEAKRSGNPIKHPAYRTKELIASWERAGYPMDTPAVDFVLAFLTAQYGCKK